MGKNPKAHRVAGYRSEYNGDVYGPADQRLAGYGPAPQADPAFMRENPGSGRVYLTSALVDVDKLPPEARGPEARWVPKPPGDRRGLALETNGDAQADDTGTTTEDQ